MLTSFDNEASLLLHTLATLDDENLAECQVWMSRCVGLLRAGFGPDHPWPVRADHITSDHLDATRAHQRSTPNNRRRALDSCLAILQGAMHEYSVTTGGVRLDPASGARGVSLENTSVAGNVVIGSTVGDVTAGQSDLGGPLASERELRPAFISYMRDDASVVHPIASQLREAKTAVWIDHEDLRAGDLWKRQIARAINEGNAVLAFLSESFEQRPDSYMHRELAFAIQEFERRSEEQRRLIPVRLDSTPLPSILADWHAIDWFENPMKGLASIIGALR